MFREQGYAKGSSPLKKTVKRLTLSANGNIGEMLAKAEHFLCSFFGLVYHFLSWCLHTISNPPKNGMGPTPFLAMPGFESLTSGRLSPCGVGFPYMGWGNLHGRS